MAGSCTPALWFSPSPARWCHSSAPWRMSHPDPRSAPALAGSGKQTHTDNHTHSKPTWLWRVCRNTRTYAHRWEICRNIQTWPEHIASHPPTNTHPHALSGCYRHGNQVSIRAHTHIHTHTPRWHLKGLLSPWPANDQGSVGAHSDPRHLPHSVTLSEITNWPHDRLRHWGKAIQSQSQHPQARLHFRWMERARCELKPIGNTESACEI